MTTAKVFMTGCSQAIRLPKEFHFEDKEVEIFRRGAANTAHEPFLTDPNQAIRATAAMHPDADAEILDRFPNDKFLGDA